jgi:hypothetical protein
MKARPPQKFLQTLDSLLYNCTVRANKPTPFLPLSEAIDIICTIYTDTSVYTVLFQISKILGKNI